MTCTEGVVAVLNENGDVATPEPTTVQPVTYCTVVPHLANNEPNLALLKRLYVTEEPSVGHVADVARSLYAAVVVTSDEVASGNSWLQS